MPTARRTLAVILLLLLAVLPACAKKTAGEKIVDAAGRRFDRIASGMDKAEVVAALGPPLTQLENVYRWEVVANPESKASLDVHFDGAGRVKKIVRSRATRN